MSCYFGVDWPNTCFSTACHISVQPCRPHNILLYVCLPLSPQRWLSSGVWFCFWQLASGSAQCGFGPRRRRVDHIVVFCVCMPLVVRPNVALSLCFRSRCFVQVQRPNHRTAHPHTCVWLCVSLCMCLCVCVCMCVLQVATPRMCWPPCRTSGLLPWPFGFLLP
jgi:hypothetical protein